MKVKIPDNVGVSISGLHVVVQGPKGKVERTFKARNVEIKKNGDIEIVAENKAIENTLVAHVKNMFKGVTDGFTKKMKIVYAHFPINIEVKGENMAIKNFLGEKKPRRVSIQKGVLISVNGTDVIVSGTSKEAVSQTVANIRRATKIKNWDGRVFQDGIYPVDEV